MEVERFPDVSAFLDRTGPFLSRREAEHNLILGLSSRLALDPRTYGSDPYLASVSGGGRVVAVALRTPPHNLVLSEVDDLAACSVLAADVHSRFGELRGVIGPAAAVSSFAGSWQQLTGARERDVRRQRIYRAERVESPSGVAGRMRPYEDGDRELCAAWLDAFVREALAESPPPEDAAAMLDRRLAETDGGLVLWEDGRPVSLAGFTGPTPNGIRIGPVYTPPELRRRGYAGALTAGLTKTLLEGGRRFCFLFTDLSNPISNSIYQRIGYEPVSDVDERLFEPPA